MTVETTTSRVSYTGSGTTGPFTIPFYFIANADIRAIKQTIATGAETELALTTDFTLTGAGDAAGGELTLISSLSSSFKLIIFRDPEDLQESAYPRNDPFPAATHEQTVDRRTMVSQRHGDLLERSVRLPDGDTSGATMIVPAEVDRASKVLGFDADGEVAVYDAESAVTEASSVTFLQSGTGAVAEIIQAVLRRQLSVFSFIPDNLRAGVIAGTNTTDLSTYIRSGATEAAATGKALNFHNYTYKYGGTTALEIDLGKFSAIGEGAVMDCSTFTGTYALKVYSSASSGTRVRNNARELRGISWEGPTTAGVHGLLHGHASNSENCDIPIKGCTFVNFDRNVEFTDNSWRASFEGCAFITPVNYNLYAPSGLTNAGESMDFTGCRFESGAFLLAASGSQWNFRGCSKLNDSGVIQNDVKVLWSDGNLENPGSSSTGFYYFDVQDDDSLLIVNGGRVTFNAPSGGGNWEQGFFKCSSAVNGIIFNGVHLPAGSATFIPQTDENNYVYVGGAGRVQVNGFATTSGLTGHQQPAVALSRNAAMNGGFETATPAIAPWTSSTFGAGGSTAEADATAKRTGSYGLHIVCSAGGGINVALTGMPAKPGDLVKMQSWVKIIQGHASNAGSISFVFVDSEGTDIGSNNNDGALTTGGSFTLHTVAAVAPKGTASVRIEINAAAQTPAIEYYVDDLILEVN